MLQKSSNCKNGPKLSDMVQNGPDFSYAFPILKFQKDTFFWDTLYTSAHLFDTQVTGMGGGGEEGRFTEQKNFTSVLR